MVYFPHVTCGFCLDCGPSLSPTSSKLMHSMGSVHDAWPRWSWESGHKCLLGTGQSPDPKAPVLHVRNPNDLSSFFLQFMDCTLCPGVLPEVTCTILLETPDAT